MRNYENLVTHESNCELFCSLIVELTQNYLRLYLTHVADDSTDQAISETGKQLPKGLLIHCISGRHSFYHFMRSLLLTKGHVIKNKFITSCYVIIGWDRTPLFISLLRISLWADGEAHESLTAAEILYLTMGYDWFLFK
jgi:hypothetical protein